MIELYEIFRKNNNELLSLFNSIPKHSLMSQRYGISKHPIWIMGHLAYSYSCMANKLGAGEELDDDWKTNFRDKAVILPVRTVYPTTEIIISEFNQQSIILYDELLLSKNITVEFFELVNNQAIHLGQLISYTLIHCIGD